MEKISDKERLDRIMSGLHCDKKEALEILAYDKAIDKNVNPMLGTLPEEKQKIAKKYTVSGTRKTPTVYNFNQRERKKNTTKQEIISKIADFLVKGSNLQLENFTIVNPERLISFSISGKKFELVLTQKRK